jgi:hypothetical protein
VSFLRSASGNDKESGRGTKHGTSSEEGEWQRYGLISVICFIMVSVKFFLVIRLY